MEDRVTYFHFLYTEKIKFANIIFNRDILNCIDYKEIVMYAKNWNNGDCDKIKMYNSYEDAINDLYIPLTYRTASGANSYLNTN